MGDELTEALGRSLLAAARAAADRHRAARYTVRDERDDDAAEATLAAWQSVAERFVDCGDADILGTAMREAGRAVDRRAKRRSREIERRRPRSEVGADPDGAVGNLAAVEGDTRCRMPAPAREGLLTYRMRAALIEALSGLTDIERKVLNYRYLVRPRVSDDDIRAELGLRRNSLYPAAARILTDLAEAAISSTK